jgi:hypothetical protein
MQAVLDRIATWEAAGIIDSETALRLRSAEADGTDEPLPADTSGPTEGRREPSTVAQIFGPGVSIGEMFAYLGGAFLLGAFDAFVVRSAGFDSNNGVPLGVAFGLVAVGLILIGRALTEGDARQRRAAGVLFVVAVSHAATAAWWLTTGLEIDVTVAGVIIGAVAVAVATGLRLYHPALTTQFALLASLTGLSAALLSLLDQIIVGDPVMTADGFVPSSPKAILVIVASAVWWLGFALLLGILGLREARAAEDPAAGRRAALTRLWAGVTAVFGLSSAVSQSGYINGEWGRVLEPWIGDLALIVLALILVERAFRRGANTFVYAAALALIIALTDFNISYLSDSAEFGLLVEGLILLGAGFAVSKLRERIGGDQTPREAETVPAPA